MCMMNNSLWITMEMVDSKRMIIFHKINLLWIKITYFMGKTNTFKIKFK
jgi:hypothetical protein